MDISLIICTRNRAGQLEQCLHALEQVEKPDADVEVILVDNNSTDETNSVMRRYTERSKWLVRQTFCARPGLGAARNVGIGASRGELIVFTDDDCYLEPHYFLNLRQRFHPKLCQYGMGQILVHDPADDERVASLKINRTRLLMPRMSVVPAGSIQGANMFFLRRVFDAVGMFDEEMGAGTPFPCEDIEMACRASHHGFTGALLPGFTVYHHHGRKRGSPEAESTVSSYDTGRGAYYASLLARGDFRAWHYWDNTFRDGLLAGDRKTFDQLARELAGASRYVEHYARQAALSNQPISDTSNNLWMLCKKAHNRLKVALATMRHMPR